MYPLPSPSEEQIALAEIASARAVTALSDQPKTYGEQPDLARATHLRILHAAPDTLTELELLETVLLLIHPESDPRGVAVSLLNRFGSFVGSTAAPVQELRTTTGVSDGCITALKLIQAAALRLVKAEIKNRPVFSSRAGLLNYLIAVLARERTEQFRVLFLDSGGTLMEDEVLSRGTINHTWVYPREVARRALELYASTVIVVHNHPSGDPTPSPADVAITQELLAALETISVTLHDHVIIGNGRWASLRDLGVIKATPTFVGL